MPASAPAVMTRVFAAHVLPRYERRERWRIVRHETKGRATRVACATVIAACLLGAATGSATAAPVGNQLLGHEAPELVAHFFVGRSRNFRLSEHRGDVVVVGFWTSWCGTCRAYLERLAKLDSTYASAGLVVIGVSLDDKPEAASDLAHALALTFPNALDADKTLGRRFAVDDVPLTLVIDRSGVVRYAHGGLDKADGAALITELRALLDE